MPCQIRLVAFSQANDGFGPCEPQAGATSSIQGIGNSYLSRIQEGHPSTIEQGIKVRRQQQAVEYIEPLCVGGAVCPGFDMGGAEKPRYSKPTDRASLPPVSKQRSAEYILPHPLYNESSRFRRIRWVAAAFLEGS